MHILGEYEFGSFGSKGNWDDLFDIIPPWKKDILKYRLSFLINYISIRNTLECAYWEFYGKNLAYRNYPAIKPKHVIKNNDEFVNYKLSILLKFGLYLEKPFILHVEGRTEEEIINHFINLKVFQPFDIVNMRSNDKFRYFYKLRKEQTNFVHFYFLDYENENNYLQKQKIAGKDCAFFFPDFITENFNPIDLVTSFLEWMKIINFIFTQNEIEELKSLLTDCKTKSNDLIRITNEQDSNFPHCPGYEKTVINFITNHERLKFCKEYNLDPDESKTYSDEIPRIVKTQLSNQLKDLISISIENDKKREQKLSLEIKIRPFLKQIIEILNSVPFHS